mmetsp:Transcript_16179/g.35076  ORF Transcript_16179/g.35076 Transcript_16179/m.35076 type:complete len:229 (-) Transcript_16179:549-1235(-)
MMKRLHGFGVMRRYDMSMCALRRRSVSVQSCRWLTPACRTSRSCSALCLRTEPWSSVAMTSLHTTTRMQKRRWSACNSCARRCATQSSGPLLCTWGRAAIAQRSKPRRIFRSKTTTRLKRCTPATTRFTWREKSGRSCRLASRRPTSRTTRGAWRRCSTTACTTICTTCQGQTSETRCWWCPRSCISCLLRRARGCTGSRRRFSIRKRCWRARSEHPIRSHVAVRISS